MNFLWLSLFRLAESLSDDPLTSTMRLCSRFDPHRILSSVSMIAAMRLMSSISTKICTSCCCFSSVVVSPYFIVLLTMKHWLCLLIVSVLSPTTIYSSFWISPSLRPRWLLGWDAIDSWPWVETEMIPCFVVTDLPARV